MTATPWCSTRMKRRSVQQFQFQQQSQPAAKFFRRKTRQLARCSRNRVAIAVAAFLTLWFVENKPTAHNAPPEGFLADLTREEELHRLADHGGGDGGAYGKSLPSDENILAQPATRGDVARVPHDQARLKKRKSGQKHITQGHRNKGTKRGQKPVAASHHQHVDVEQFLEKTSERAHAATSQNHLSKPPDSSSVAGAKPSERARAAASRSRLSKPPDSSNVAGAKPVADNTPVPPKQPQQTLKLAPHLNAEGYQMLPSGDLVKFVNVLSTTGIKGHTTYEVGVTVSGAVRNVYTLAGSHTHISKIPPAYQVPAPFGTNSGGVNPAYFPYNKDCQYDSWLTVGKTDSSGGLGAVGISYNDWTEKTGITFNNGAIFWMDPNSAKPARASPDSDAVNVVLAHLTIVTGSVFTMTLGELQGRSFEKSEDWQVRDLLLSNSAL